MRINENKSLKGSQFIKKVAIIFVACLILLTATGIYIYNNPRAKAYVVMGLVSSLETYQSNQSIELDIPTRSSETHWFPHMIVFNDRGGFNTWANERGDLTIYYTFGDFENDDYASIYDETSPYYSSFYGGYVIKGVGEDQSTNVSYLAKIPSYDYQNLILRDLGCLQANRFFKYEIMDLESSVSYANKENWQRYDIQIDTSGVYHLPVDDKLHYLQFGKPPVDDTRGDSFGAVSLYGRIYAKYFETQDTQVVLYILAADQSLLEKTDEVLLSKSKIIN